MPAGDALVAPHHLERQRCNRRVVRAEGRCVAAADDEPSAISNITIEHHGTWVRLGWKCPRSADPNGTPNGISRFGALRH